MDETESIRPNAIGSPSPRPCIWVVYAANRVGTMGKSVQLGVFFRIGCGLAAIALSGLRQRAAGSGIWHESPTHSIRRQGDQIIYTQGCRAPMTCNVPR